MKRGALNTIIVFVTVSSLLSFVYAPQLSLAKQEHNDNNKNRANEVVEEEEAAARRALRDESPGVKDLQAKYPAIEVLTDAYFEEAVFPSDAAPSDQRPFIIMFFAPWCQHCRSILPFFNEASTILLKHDAYRFDSAKLAIVDATANKRLARKFHVTSYPVFFYTLNGRAFEYNAAVSTTDFLQVAAYIFAGKKFKTFADDFSNPKVLEQVVAVESPARPMLVNCARRTSGTPPSPSPATAATRSTFDVVADSTVTYGKVRYGRITDTDATKAYWTSSSDVDDTQTATSHTTSSPSPWVPQTSYLAPEVEAEVGPKLKRGVQLSTLSSKERIDVLHWRMKAACWEGWRLIDQKARRRASLNVSLLSSIRAAPSSSTTTTPTTSSVLDRVVASLYNLSSSIASSPTSSTTTEPCTSCFNAPTEEEIEMEAATPSLSPDGTFMFMAHDATERPIFFKGHWGRDIATVPEQSEDNDDATAATTEKEGGKRSKAATDEQEGEEENSINSISSHAAEEGDDADEDEEYVEENADVIRVKGSSKYQVHPDVYHFFLEYGILAVDLLSPERLSHVSKHGKFAVVALGGGVSLADMDGEKEYVPTLRNLMNQRYATHVFQPEHAARVELIKKEYAELVQTANRHMKRVFKRHAASSSSTTTTTSSKDSNAAPNVVANTIAQSILSGTPTGKDLPKLASLIVADRAYHSNNKKTNSVFVEQESKAYPPSVMFPSVPIARVVGRQRSATRGKIDTSSEHLSPEAASVLYGHPMASSSKILHLFVGDFATYREWVQTYGYTGDSTPVLFVADMKREIGWRIEDWLPPGRSLTYSTTTTSDPTLVTADGIVSGKDGAAIISTTTPTTDIRGTTSSSQQQQTIDRTISTISTFFVGVETGEIKGVSTTYIGMIALLLLDYVPFMYELHSLVGADNSIFVLVVGCMIMFVLVLVVSIKRGAGPEEEEEPPIQRQRVVVVPPTPHQHGGGRPAVQQHPATPTPAHSTTSGN